MATTAAVLVRVDDSRELIERAAIAGFLAGYSGNTLTSYTTDLRLFTAWCVEHGVGLFDVKRPHLELFARSMETAGRMPATVARRLSTLCGFYRYCHDEGLGPATRPPTCAGPRSTRSPAPSVWTATSSAPCWSRPDWGRFAITR
jgi:site-specific recombinase XerD